MLGTRYWRHFSVSFEKYIEVRPQHCSVLNSSSYVENKLTLYSFDMIYAQSEQSLRVRERSPKLLDGFL
jgi:hypothetical protein